MSTALRNRMIGLGFKAWIWSVRTRRLLGALGRPRLRGVEHFTIPVKDLAVARRFYCDVLGGALMMTIDDAALKKFGRPPAPSGGEGSHHLSVYLGGSTRVDLFLQQVGQTAPTLGHPHYAFGVPPHRYLNEFPKRTLLRQSVYETVARRWRELGLDGEPPTLSDFHED